MEPTPPKTPDYSTRFGAGNNANPQGKTSEQKKLEIENAVRATRLRGRFLLSLEAQIEIADRAHEKAREEGEDVGEIHTATPMAMITSEILKLLKDTEDRGLGTSAQSIALTNPDGNLKNKSDAELEAQIIAIQEKLGVIPRDEPQPE